MPGALIANWYEGEPVSDVRLNQMVNAVNSVAAGTAGIAVLTAPTTTWVVPIGVTSDTRLRIWVVASGSDYDESGEGVPANWGYGVKTGYTGGVSVPVVIGTGLRQPTSFNSGVLVSFWDGLNPAISSTGGILWTSPKTLTHGRSLGTPQDGVIVIEW